MSTHRHTSLPSGAIQLLRSHRDAAVGLPHPHRDPFQTYTRHDLPPETRELFKTLVSYGIIESVRRFKVVKKSGDYNIDRFFRLYRTRPDPTLIAELERIESSTTGGCPHSGIKNLGDGQYTCGQPDEVCSARFDRETAREVLDG